MISLHQLGLFVIVALVVLGFIYFLNRLNVSNLKISDFFAVTLLPDYHKDFLLSTTDKLDFVISTDGNISKIHVVITYKGKEDTSINNSTLAINQIGSFVFKQFFAEVTNRRVGINSSKTLEKDKVHQLGLEFEQKEGWQPLSPKIGKFKALLKVKLLDTTIKHKFSFQIRDQNLKAMKIKNTTHPQIVSVPIIKN